MPHKSKCMHSYRRWNLSNRSVEYHKLIDTCWSTYLRKYIFTDRKFHWLKFFDRIIVVSSDFSSTMHTFSTMWWWNKTINTFSIEYISMRDHWAILVKIPFMVIDDAIFRFAFRNYSTLLSKNKDSVLKTPVEVYLISFYSDNSILIPRLSIADGRKLATWIASKRCCTIHSTIWNRIQNQLKWNNGLYGLFICFHHIVFIYLI